MFNPIVPCAARCPSVWLLRVFYLYNPILPCARCPSVWPLRVSYMFNPIVSGAAGARVSGLYGCPICGQGLAGQDLDSHYMQVQLIIPHYRNGITSGQHIITVLIIYSFCRSLTIWQKFHLAFCEALI